MNTVCLWLFQHFQYFWQTVRCHLKVRKILSIAINTINTTVGRFFVIFIGFTPINSSSELILRRGNLNHEVSFSLFCSRKHLSVSKSCPGKLSVCQSTNDGLNLSFRPWFTFNTWWMSRDLGWGQSGRFMTQTESRASFIIGWENLTEIGKCNSFSEQCCSPWWII